MHFILMAILGALYGLYVAYEFVMEAFRTDPITAILWTTAVIIAIGLYAVRRSNKNARKKHEAMIADAERTALAFAKEKADHAARVAYRKERAKLEAKFNKFVENYTGRGYPVLFEDEIYNNIAAATRATGATAAKVNANGYFG